MKILAIADTVDPILYEHFDRGRWADVSLVLSCGDLPPQYLDFLCTSLSCPVLYVRGNHDTAYERDRYSGCFDLARHPWTDMGLTVVGFEGSQRYNGRDLQYSEGEMRRKVWRATRRLHQIDIVVTHAPPLGLQDRPDVCHSGFACYRDLIEQKHPRLFIHGHSHMFGAERRELRVGETKTINAFGHCLLEL